MDEEELANPLTLLQEGLIQAGMSSLVKSRNRTRPSRAGWRN